MAAKKPAKQLTTKAKAKAASKALGLAEPEPNPAELRIHPVTGKTRTEMLAMVAVEGVAGNASLTNGFSSGIGMGGNDLTACVDEMRAIAKRVEGGELRDCEKILVAQAVTLNAMFVELARRGANNMGEYPAAMERYLRLALKARAQSRCTMETLAEMKNPRQVTFAKQANIANGPQQVNNGTARAETESKPIELLEAENGEWMDRGAAGAAAGSHPEVETVGAVHGAKD